MGSVKKNVFDDGFSVTYDDGIQETFYKNLLDDNYHGNKGSTIHNNFLDDGFTVCRFDGKRESFRKNWLDDNLTGNQGTHINKNLLDDNYHTYNSNTSNTQNHSTWGMDYDQHVNNGIGVGFALLNFIVFKIAGMGIGRTIISSVIVMIFVAGLLDTVKDIKKRRYTTQILIEDAIGAVIGGVILLGIYLFILDSYF